MKMQPDNYARLLESLNPDAVIAEAENIFDPTEKLKAFAKIASETPKLESQLIYIRLRAEYMFKAIRQGRDIQKAAKQWRRYWNRNGQKYGHSAQNKRTA
jgi:hypothetical protein